MKVKKAIAGLALAAAGLSAGVAYGWGIQEDHGSWDLLRCQDGSNATVSQMRDGSWTVTAAGAHGQVGGRFAIVGKAALYGCGE